MRNCSVVICDRFTTWFEWQFWYSGRRGENVMQRLSFSSNKSCDFYKSRKTCLKTTKKCLIFQNVFLFTFGAMSTKGWRRGTSQHRADFKTKTRRLFEWLSKHCDWPTFVSQEITNTPAGLKSIKVWPGSLSLLKEGVMGLPCAEPGRGAKWSIRMDSRPVRVRFRIRRCMSPWPPNPRYQLPETIWCSESEKYCASCKILQCNNPISRSTTGCPSYLFTFGAMSTKGWRRGTPQHSAARTAQPSKQKPQDFFSGFQNIVIHQLLLVKKFQIGHPV